MRNRIVIFANYLSQIPVLAKEMGLREDQYAVRTGERNEKLNELGLTSLMKTEKDGKSAHRDGQGAIHNACKGPRRNRTSKKFRG